MANLPSAASASSSPPDARPSVHEAVPRFHETGLFVAATGLGALIALTGLAAWQGAKRRALQGELERLVEERTATISRQAERLRELDGLRREFFANVSHEFRTPLTLMIGPLQDLLEERFGALADEQVKEIETVARNARRLLILVEQLLEVSKIDAGRLHLDWRWGDLAAYVRRRVDSFLSLAERRGIELTLVGASEPIALWFDPAQLEKVLFNLLSNALKFTPRGGAVQVAVTVGPAVGGRAPFVEVTVCDDGPGIPADEIDRVFDRFHQVQPSAHRWPGMGIGLALARQLVDLHQGWITVANRPGHGAIFTIRLRTGAGHVAPDRVAAGLAVEETKPLLPSLLEGLGGAPGAEAITPESADDPRTTILLVEDNAEIRAYVRRHLEPEYRVVEAADGRAGLEAARRWIPDLVVSDIMMPEMDGQAFFRALRQEPELAQVPFFLLTAKASQEERLQGLLDGVDDYLTKPFDPRELRVRIENLLASRRRLLERSSPPPRAVRLAEAEVTPADEDFLRRVQETIEARLGDAELNVEALASALRCDRSYLLRRLRALTGHPPSELIRSLRLQRSEQLLREGAGSVSEVAYSVGFKSVAHFSNAFHLQFGERPSALMTRSRGARSSSPTT